MNRNRTIARWCIKVALVLVLAAILTATLAPIALPFPIAALGGGKPDYSWLIQAFGLGDPIETWKYAMGILSEQEHFVSSLGILYLLATAFLGCALASAIMRDSKRNVSNGILGKQESIASKSRIKDVCPTWNGESDPADGVVAGFVRKKAVIVPCTHAAINAPSGSHKTRGSVYPTIDALSWRGTNNLIITDPSMEIFAAAGPCLRERGYDVHLIDLENPRQGTRWNPIKLIADLYRNDLDLARAEAYAQEIGAILFPETGGENDIFINGAAGLFSAVAFKVATLAEVDDDEDRHLWSVASTILEGTSNGTAPLKAWLTEEGYRSPHAVLAKIFLDAEGKFEASILGELHNGMRYLNSANARWLTSRNDLDIAALPHKPSAVFIHTLGPGNPANKLASLFFSQLWAETQRQGRWRAMRPCWVIGDEWHAIPRFDLVTAIEQGRKYGLHFIMYTQSFSGYDQYRTSKEDGKDAILANCDVKALFKAGSAQDARYFEELSGYKTVRVESVGSTRNGWGSNSSNMSYSEQAVPVWPMGEILARNPLKDGALVIRNAGYGFDSAKLEIPLIDASKTFVADHFKTLGSPQFEKEVLGRTFNELRERASSIPLDVHAWVPDFAKIDDSEIGTGASVENDEWAAWD